MSLLRISISAVIFFVAISARANSVLEKFAKDLGSSEQVIVVQSSNGPRALVSTYEKQNDAWKELISLAPAVIGKNGFAAINEKREGDGRSPTGVFPIGFAFGYAPTSITKLEYRQATDQDYFIDDVNSDLYNQWVSGNHTAKSFEKMKRKDGLYELGFVVKYNMEPVVKGKGSAIFFHVWRAADKGTAGCVALAKDKITQLLKWLDPAKTPKVILNLESK